MKLDEEERELKRQAFQEEQSRLLNLVEKSSIAARTAKEQECSAKMMLQDRYRCVEEEDKRMCEEINRKWKEEECRRKRYVEELCRTAEEEERRLEIIRNEYKQCSCLLEKIKVRFYISRFRGGFVEKATLWWVGYRNSEKRHFNQFLQKRAFFGLEVES